jgi:hypothetical protein
MELFIETWLITKSQAFPIENCFGFHAEQHLHYYRGKESALNKN